jgi:transcriptional regulator with XRE-family HTH domain
MWMIRAARGLLGWSQADLAHYAGVARPTIENIERGADSLHSTMASIEKAFNKAGLKFIRPDADGGEGVRLISVKAGEKRQRRRRPKKPIK